MRISWFDDAWRSKTEQTAERLFCLTHYMLRGRVEKDREGRKIERERERVRMCDRDITTLAGGEKRKTGILFCLFLNSIRKLLIQSRAREAVTITRTHKSFIHR